MQVNRFDHVVLTVADIDATIDFYSRVLGMTPQTFAGGRRALQFGSSKFNLHQAGHEFEPKADRATPGSADLCLIVDDPLDEVIAQLRLHDVPLVEGPVPKTGACGELRSVYIRDPDGNLIELSNYV
jgi:catechol 2,3-dioxygenase-like lactoylglutathione lyase family enzyme